MRRRLEARHSKAPSVADFLPYALPYGPGGVLTKRGALIAGYYFNPPDSASSTNGMQEYISRRVNTALARIGTGWSSWTDAISIPAAAYPRPEDSCFPDAFSRMVDEERRQAFEAEGAHFENERVVTFCWTPPNASMSTLEKLLYKGGDGRVEAPLSRYQRAFENVLRQFEDECGQILGLRRMTAFKVEDNLGCEHQQDELVNYLNYAVTGSTHGVMIPEWGAYLDVLIAGQEIHFGETPVIGDDLVAVVAVDGFPAESSPNILAALSTLRMPFRFTQRMIFQDGVHAERDIGSYRKKWASKVKPIMSVLLNTKNAPLNAHALQMVQDADAASALAASDLVRYGYYSASLIIRDGNHAALLDKAREVRTIARSCGFGARIETVNTFEAWRGSLPGDTRSNVRRPLIHTGNLADLLPLSGVWTGSAVAPSPTYPPGAPALMHARTIGSIPFRANFHVSDVGHTLCFGPTGAGKSALMNATALQALRYEGMRITCFDHKRGMLATAVAAGGRHFEIGDGAQPIFSPLGVLESDADRLWAQEWIGTCCQLVANGQELNPDQRHQVFLAVERLARGDKRHRSMSDFMLACSDRVVKKAISFYTLNGPAGGLFDAREDGIADSHFNVFETLPLMSMGPSTSLPALLYLFRRFERSLDGRPALLYISEAWQALGNDVWCHKVREWLKLLRSKNCAVIMDTQSLSDAVRSNLLDVLVESCPTKLFLPNVEAFKTGSKENPGPYDFYQTMGLNNNQIEIIRTARSKRDVYWTSPLGSRLIDSGLGPILLSIAGATSEEDVVRVKRLISEHGEDEWLWAFLRHKRVPFEHLIGAESSRSVVRQRVAA